MRELWLVDELTQTIKPVECGGLAPLCYIGRKVRRGYGPT